jgi:hypothetical protein
MMLGRVDEVDGDFVATRFVAFAVPIECVYVSNKVSRASSSGMSSENVRIQTNWRSVALAYGRVWLPAVALVIPLLQGILGRVPITTWVLSAVMLAISAVAHRSGGLPEHEKARLRLLGSVTGFRIDPTKLEPRMRETKRDSLGQLMEKGGIPTTPDGILSVLEEIPMPAVPLVYGYATYAGDTNDWRDCAALVYQRHQQGAEL